MVLERANVSLTRNQKFNVKVTVVASVVVALVGFICFLAVNALSSNNAAATNTPPVHQVNMSHYTVVNPGSNNPNGDPSVDHFCSGSTGLWYEQSSPYAFQVLGNDPLCR